jgi:hypothetical protein
MKITLPIITLTAILVITLAVPFFTISTSSIAHADPANKDWQLAVTGLVQTPLNLNLTQLAALPQTTEFAALYCVDEPSYVVAQGNWTGVKLSQLLDEANVSNTAIKVAFHASDGYSTDLTIQVAMQDDVIVAYEKDGVPLAETLRLVVPAHWGYKWICLITSIELVNYDYFGKWESSGYTDTGNIVSGSPNTQGSIYGPKFPTASSLNNASPSPVPSAFPTESPTPSPSPSYSPVVTQTPSPSPTPTTSPSPSYLPTTEPNSSSNTPQTLNIYPYALASAVIAMAVAVSAIVIRKKKTAH